jgi:hypothetical protein
MSQVGIGIHHNQTAVKSVTPRQRGIEDILNEIGMELNEAVNSSADLADKLLMQDYGPESGTQSQVQSPDPSHLTFRLEKVLRMVQQVNLNISRGHAAING